MTEVEEESVNSSEETKTIKEENPLETVEEVSLTEKESKGTEKKSDRDEAHEKLRAYESCRRSSFEGKLNSSMLYWKSFLELMASSVEETARAANLIRAHAIADETYSTHMEAIYENMLETNGKPIVDDRKKKKILATRSNTETVSILMKLLESHAVLADGYAENAQALNEEILPELDSLAEDLASQVAMIEVLGDAILGDLKVSEKEVQNNWSNYYSLVCSVKSLDKSNNTGATITLDNNDVEVSDPISDCQDVWIVEMQYRMSVAFLSAFWDKCSSELSRIFATMKNAECSRRVRLRQLCIDFAERKERLWKSLPTIISPVLDNLVSLPTEKSTIEDDVQASIRLKAQTIQKNQKEIIPPPHESLQNVDSNIGNFELSSPLLSGLISRAKVVEKRTTGMMATWKISLAVVTVDSFLHLFDIPSSLKVTCSSTSEVAFYALVPPVTAPNEDTIKSSSTSPTIKKWNVNLSPAESFVLQNCKIAFKDDSKNSAFEIVETILNTGAAKVFGKIYTRKLFLRTKSRNETVELIDLLKSPSSSES